MTHTDNPRFATAIANRVWQRIFGLAVQEPVTDLYDLTKGSNPELLAHLTNDPVLRRFVERILAAYPAELPNRTDISPHALNTNARQSIDTDDAGIRLDQLHDKEQLTLQYHFTNQKVTAFQFVAGQNPDTDTKAHTARATWSRAWNAVTTTTFTAGFDRLRSLLVPEPNSLGPQVSFGGSIDQLGPASNLPRRDRYRAAWEQN